MDNKYKDLTVQISFAAEDIALLRETSDVAQQVGAFIEKVACRTAGRPGADLVELAIDDLQEGFLKLAKSLAQPITN